MKIYPRRKKLFTFVTIVWLLIFLVNIGFALYYMREPALSTLLFVSLLVLIFFKSVFNALVSYPEALRGELVFGNIIADVIYIFRQLFKAEKIKKY